jgi:phage terminase large subunit GpA-like protein
LAEARQTTFSSNAKSYYYSSPTIKNESRIESLYLEGTQRVALAECIHCGHSQELVFEKLFLAESGEALYPCEQCGGLHRDADKKKMFQSGLWSEPKVESKTESFLLSAMYQPYGWYSWTDLYSQHQEALADLDRGIEQQMIVFYNTRLARSWKRTTDITKFEILRDRAEDYRLRIAPEGVLIITAGVDTQDNRLAVQIVGYGLHLKAWVLDYVELMGDPAEDDVWDQLTKLLNTKVQHVLGHEIPISATLIDTGGHRGEAVKNYVRSRRISNPIAGYGAVKINARPLGKGTMQDVNWKGTLDKKGIMLHAVGTIEIKHVLFSRLKNDGEKDIEDRMLHFSSDLDDYYFAGVLSETYDNRKKRYINKPGVRNEPLDTLVYSFAALHHQRIRADRFTENDWNKYLFRVNNPQSQKNLSTNATQLQKQTGPRREGRFGGFQQRFSSRFGRRR